MSNVIRVISDEPIPDRVEVTRCRDCAHFVETAIGWCMNHDLPTYPHYFCAWAERRAESTTKE